MKSVFALVTGLLISASAFAAQSGEFTCASKDNKHSTTYKIGTLTQGNVSVTVLEVVRVTTDENGVTKTTTVKGVANQFTNDEGQEILTLGNHYIELVAGRPSCVQ